MNNTVDLAITYRILKQLIQPWKSQDAYKLGIIDETGSPLKNSKDLKTDKEKDAYSILTRLVFKLKRILDKVPSGIRSLGGLAVAMSVLKECVAQDQYPEDIESLYENALQHLSNEDIVLTESILKSSEFRSFLIEDGEALSQVPANNTVGISGTGDDKTTPVIKLFDKPLRRKTISQLRQLER